MCESRNFQDWQMWPGFSKKKKTTLDLLDLIDMVRLFTYLMKVSPNCQQVIASKVERSPGALEGSAYKGCIVAMGLIL